MQKYKKILLALTLIFVFLIVYSPHQDYKFPYHVDEWHHITEAIKLKQGQYAGGITGYRIGFHILLVALSYFIDLVLSYQFLPAIWAAISALVLFHITNKLTKNYWIALFAAIFFASIKSNVNFTGLWFFTPLTFAIPLIYLSIYFFTQGLEKENKKYIIASLAIMLSLIFIHSISLLFAIPFLTIYALTKHQYLKKEWKFFSLFLLIPILGLLFYSFMTSIPLSNAFSRLLSALKFRKEWGVFIWNNSFLELYSFIGYALAIIGTVGILAFEKSRKKYLPYILWPIAMLISIYIYKQTGTSYLTPYQRNLYYFAISLPLLSALGLHYTLNSIKTQIKKLTENENKIKLIKKTTFIVLLIIVFILTFQSYYETPEPLKLYRVIEQNDYEAMMFLSNYPQSTVMAHFTPSTAIYPVSGHKPVGTIVFYGNRGDTEKFFESSDCKTKQEILNKHNASFVLSSFPINCSWELIYEKENYIYKIK